MIYSGLVIQARAHSGRYPSKRDPSTFDQTIRPHAFQAGSVLPRPLNHFKNVVSNGAPLDYSKMYGRGRKSAQRSRFFEQLTDVIKSAQPPGQPASNGQPLGQTTPSLPPGQQPPVSVADSPTEFETSIEAADAYNDVREKSDEAVVPPWRSKDKNERIEDRRKSITESLAGVVYDEKTAEMIEGLLSPNIVVKSNSSEYTDSDYYTPNSSQSSNIPIKDGTAFSPVVTFQPDVAGGIYPIATESEPIYMETAQNYIDQGNNYLTIVKRDQEILEYVKENSDKIINGILLKQNEEYRKIEFEIKKLNERVNNLSDIVDSKISKSSDQMTEALVKKFTEIDQAATAAFEKIALDFKGYMKTMFDYFNEKYDQGFKAVRDEAYQNRTYFQQVALVLEKAFIKLTRDIEKLKMLGASLNDVIQLEQQLSNLESEKIRFENETRNQLENDHERIAELYNLNMETDGRLKALAANRAVREEAVETNLQTNNEIAARTKIRTSDSSLRIQIPSPKVAVDTTSELSGSLYIPSPTNSSPKMASDPPLSGSLYAPSSTNSSPNMDVDPKKKVVKKPKVVRKKVVKTPNVGKKSGKKSGKKGPASSDSYVPSS